MNILFAKTRQSHQSYTDFWKLVELSGFQTCFVDEIDLLKEILYITTLINGEISPHLAHRRSLIGGRQNQKCRIAWWNLERPDSHSMERKPLPVFVRDEAVRMLKEFDAVWHSDRWISSLSPDIRYVEMGSHPGLAPSGPARASTVYDIAHMSYVVSRRQAVLGRLQGLRIAPNCWEAKRDTVLRSTRAMLNIHQTNAPIIEPLRIALSAAYALPYLTEDAADPWPLEPGKTCLSAPHSALANSVREWLCRDLEPLGHALRDRLTVNTDFARSILQVVKESFPWAV